MYSGERNTARFVSIDENRAALFVEATSSNLEVASIIRAARGRLNADAARDVREAVRQLRLTDPAVIGAMHPIESIDHRGLLADITGATENDIAQWLGLAMSALPEEVAGALERAASSASKLEPYYPHALVQVASVGADRAEKIRTDPRHVYTFAPVRQQLITAMPRLFTAFRNPGRVTDVGKREAAALSDWRHRSNPSRLGETLFVEVEGDALHGTFQVHARPGPIDSTS